MEESSVVGRVDIICVPPPSHYTYRNGTAAAGGWRGLLEKEKGAARG